MTLRKERIDRGIKARSEDIFALSSYREIIEDIVQIGVDKGWIVEHLEPGQGGPKRMLYSGPERPE